MARGSAKDLQQIASVIDSIDKPVASETNRADSLSDSGLAAELAASESALAKANATYGSSHPKLRELRQQVELAKKALQEATQMNSRVAGRQPVPSADRYRSAANLAYKNAEREAAKLADRIRRTKDEDERKQLRSELRGVVEKAFKIRQADEKQKIESAAKSLETVRERFDARKENAAKIIDRRVEDLVQGIDLSWLSEADRMENERREAAIEKNLTTPNLSGDIALQVAPELGQIMMRGTKDDVQGVVETIRKIERSAKDKDANPKLEKENR